MKKYFHNIIVLIGLCLIVFGCKNQTTSLSSNDSRTCEISTYNYEIKLSHSNDETKELAEGFEYGHVVSYVAENGTIEQHMIDSYRAYQRALMTSEPELLKKYLDINALKYMHRIARENGESFDMTIEEFAKEICEDVSAFNNSLSEQGVTVTYAIGSLIRKIICDNNVFIVFDGTMNLLLPDKAKIHAVPMETNVGISTDNGKNWVFVAVDETFPLTYEVIYSDDEIDAIMGY